jgi:Asp-tRNA(Asn)/Glu-tRNA(Gln) amidotransferase C subunit
MSLTQEQIQRLGKLTALSPHEELNISSVLDSFDSLKSIDTSQIEMVSRSGKGSLTPRADIVVDAGLSDELLACSHQRKAAHQIMLGGIMVGE